MKKRILCLASLVLVALALGFDAVSKIQFSQSISLRAHSIFASSDQQQQMRAKAVQDLMKSKIWGISGLVLAISSLVCLAVSFRKREPAWFRSVPVALLVVYLLMQFTLV